MERDLVQVLIGRLATFDAHDQGAYIIALARLLQFLAAAFYPVRVVLPFEERQGDAFTGKPTLRMRPSGRVQFVLLITRDRFCPLQCAIGGDGCHIDEQVPRTEPGPLGKFSYDDRATIRT